MAQTEKTNYKFESIEIVRGKVRPMYYYEGYITFPFSKDTERFAMWAFSEDMLGELLYDEFGIFSTIVFE